MTGHKIDRESVLLLLEEAREQADNAEMVRGALTGQVNVASLQRSIWHLAASVRRLSEAVSSLLPPEEK